jgi:hypothetical protein
MLAELSALVCSRYRLAAGTAKGAEVIAATVQQGCHAAVACIAACSTSAAKWQHACRTGHWHAAGTAKGAVL